MLTRDRLERAIGAGQESAPIYNLALSDYRYVHPDHSLEIVIDRLGQTPGLLPVVSRSNMQQLVGMITSESLMQFVKAKSQGGAAAVSRTEREIVHHEPAA